MATAEVHYEVQRRHQWRGSPRLGDWEPVGPRCDTPIGADVVLKHWLLMLGDIGEGSTYVHRIVRVTVVVVNEIGQELASDGRPKGAGAL